MHYPSQRLSNFMNKGPLLLNDCVIWTIVQLKEDIMVLHLVTKFHKILIKTIPLRGRALF